MVSIEMSHGSLGSFHVTCFPVLFCIHVLYMLQCIVFKHVVQFYFNTCLFWCPFLEPHPITYRSDASVHRTESGMITMLKVKLKVKMLGTPYNLEFLLSIFHLGFTIHLETQSEYNEIKSR